MNRWKCCFGNRFFYRFVGCNDINPLKIKLINRNGCPVDRLAIEWVIPGIYEEWITALISPSADSVEIYPYHSFQAEPKDILWIVIRIRAEGVFIDGAAHTIEHRAVISVQPSAGELQQAAVYDVGGTLQPKNHTAEQKL